MTSQGDRRRTAPSRSSRAARTAVAALALAALLAACGRTVAGTLEGGPTAGTASSSAPQTGSSTSGTGETSASADSSSSETTETTETTESTDSTDSTGTTDSTGSSSTDSTRTSGTGTADYPTTPIPYAKTPRNATIGGLLEGRRLAQYSVDPFQVDQKYNRINTPTMPIYGPKGLSLTFEQPTITAADRGGMYTGYVAAKGAKDDGGLLIAALVYPSAASASTAVRALAATVKGDEDVPVKLSSLPSAAGWRGVVAGSTYSAQAFVATGSVVAYAYVSGATADRAALVATLERALRSQVASLRAYKPVPENQLQQQPFDPTGLYARTLPATGEGASLGSGVFAAAGALHTQIDYALSAEAFADAGVDLVSIGKSVVYRARDAAGAGRLRDAFYAEQVAADSAWRDYDPGTGAGSARCLENSTQATYICYGTTGRYTLELNSTSEQDMQAQLEAQVTLLGG